MAKKKTIEPAIKAKITTLAECPVQFIAGEHRYIYRSLFDEKELSGVTSLLSRQLFGSKYAGIPQHILDAAAERGTAVHELCEFEDVSGLPCSHDIEAYAQAAHCYTSLREGAGYTAFANEYLVSDLDHVASAIDCVWKRDNSIALVDIKTTIKLDLLYLSWQLSVYAYLFEMQNIGTDVDELYAIWLPFKGGDFDLRTATLCRVKRIPDEYVRALIQADKEGRQYEPPKEYAPEKVIVPATMQGDVPALITQDVLARYLEACRQLKEAEQVKKDVEKALLQAMEEHNIKTWDAEAVRFTRTEPSESVGFDAKAFQAENPELYQKYMTKVTKRAASLRSTVREE